MREGKREKGRGVRRGRRGNTSIESLFKEEESITLSIKLFGIEGGNDRGQFGGNNDKIIFNFSNRFNKRSRGIGGSRKGG